MIRTKFPEENSEIPASKRFRPRRFKDRPTDVDTLVSAIASKRLDGRTLAARQIRALREAVERDPVEAARALVADVLSINGVILASLLEATTRTGTTLVDKDGTPHPLVTRYVPDVQRSIIAASNTLLKLEQASGQEIPKTPRIPKSKPGNDDASGGDVSALVLELTEGRKNNED